MSAALEHIIEVVMHQVDTKSDISAEDRNLLAKHGCTDKYFAQVNRAMDEMLGPKCDLCKMFYACDDLDSSRLPPTLRQILADDDEEGIILCAGCIQVLGRESRRIPEDLRSFRELKVVVCSTCGGEGRQDHAFGHSAPCRGCDGKGRTLTIKSPLERLADAASE